CQQHHSYPYSF
nr:immunoglobulin light chain junction region [Macaca mulatta]MOW73883.1 immunoglobulin light chain junction region [Macaca mulatta]MOW74112.1 immunoglobulin light chain junction region [Macaca mulatta]MOW74801.1 immunoglobulin light chain junction region [Macaca mulatta]MOW74956.1 immunoglobulin light chain junction region [Macaca mulatta]